MTPPLWGTASVKWIFDLVLLPSIIQWGWDWFHFSAHKRTFPCYWISFPIKPNVLFPISMKKTLVVFRPFYEHMCLHGFFFVTFFFYYFYTINILFYCLGAQHNFPQEENRIMMIEISSYWHFSTKIVLSKIKNSDLKNIWGEWQMCADFINLLTDVSVFLKNSGCNWLPSNWQLLEFSCTVLQCTRGEHKAKPWRMVIPQLPVSQSHWMCWGWEPSPMYIYKAKWSPNQ